MTEEFKRKLTAILSADVSGYSRLMDDDEEATIRTLKDYRFLIAETVKQYRGRVVDSPGDNILAEFASVVDAVKCAVEIQRELYDKNADLTDDRKMQFRIGINLGDVVEEDDRIYGDGVNIAARVESFAEAGGICISGKAYDQVWNKLDLGYEDLGEKIAKNIKRPIRVYKVPIDHEHKDEESILDSIIDMSVPTDKPSIAVLPFDNMSGDPEQEYFSDGITEEIITALSKIPDMLVIARNSTFVYKGKAVNVKQVSKELGVKYVLEGSVRKAGNRVRVTAQLIDAKTGNHKWSERYDRDLNDIFKVQDEITLNIVKAFQLNLGSGLSRALVKGSTNLEANLMYYQGLQKFWQMNERENVLARQLGEEIIKIEPNWANGHIILAHAYLSEFRYGWGNSPVESAQFALKFAEKAFDLDNSNSLIYFIRCHVYLLQREHDKAIAEGKKAVELRPDVDSYATLGYALNYNGSPKEALSIFKKAIRINPKDDMIFWLLGISYCDAGQYQEAIISLKKSLQKNPNNTIIRTRLAVTYSLANQLENARSEVDKIHDIDPSFSLANYETVLMYKNQSDTDRILNALRKAGLK